MGKGADDGGEKVQIAIALTCPKKPVEAGGVSAAPASGWDFSDKAVTASTPVSRAEVTPEELGFQKKNLKEIAGKYNRGFYISLIDGLPIESSEKKRLLRDADIQEAEIVEDLSDEPTDFE